jgi:hypothetical protein
MVRESASGDLFMQSTIMAIPILPGKTEAVKEMFKTVKEEN